MIGNAVIAFRPAAAQRIRDALRIFFPCEANGLQVVMVETSSRPIFRMRWLRAAVLDNPACLFAIADLNGIAQATNYATCLEQVVWHAFDRIAIFYLRWDRTNPHRDAPSFFNEIIRHLAVSVRLIDSVPSADDPNRRNSARAARVGPRVRQRPPASLRWRHQSARRFGRGFRLAAQRTRRAPLSLWKLFAGHLVNALDRSIGIPCAFGVSVEVKCNLTRRTIVSVSNCNRGIARLEHRERARQSPLEDIDGASNGRKLNQARLLLCYTAIAARMNSAASCGVTA